MLGHGWLFAGYKVGKDFTEALWVETARLAYGVEVIFAFMMGGGLLVRLLVMALNEYLPEQTTVTGHLTQWSNQKIKLPFIEILSL